MLFGPRFPRTFDIIDCLELIDLAKSALHCILALQVDM